MELCCLDRNIVGCCLPLPQGRPAQPEDRHWARPNGTSLTPLLLDITFVSCVRIRAVPSLIFTALQGCRLDVTAISLTTQRESRRFSNNPPVLHISLVTLCIASGKRIGYSHTHVNARRTLKWNGKSRGLSTHAPACETCKYPYSP